MDKISNAQDRFDLKKKLESYNEIQLRLLLKDFFEKSGYEAKITHGTTEYGADIQVIVSGNDDFVGTGQVWFIQVKSGMIRNEDWKNKVSAQMVECIVRHITDANISQVVPRRILLITNGEIADTVVTVIRDWNQRIQIPIEVINGHKLATLFEKNKYDSTKMDEFFRSLVPTVVGTTPKEIPKHMVGETSEF